MLLTADEMKLFAGLKVRLSKRISKQPIMDYNSRDNGGSLEFNDYQQFTPGENIRHIDWNRYMRDSSLVVRQYDKMERPEFTVAVDLSSTVAMGKKYHGVE